MPKYERKNKKVNHRGHGEHGGERRSKRLATDGSRLTRIFKNEEEREE